MVDLEYKMYENRKYLIIPSDIVNDIDFSEVMESSIDTLRYSVDGTKTFVKYDIVEYTEEFTSTYVDEDTGEDIEIINPPGIYGRPSIFSSEYVELSHDEMLEVLDTTEWKKDNKDLYTSESE
jgi:hypothetical protein